MAALQGWLGLGTFADNVFVEFTGYLRCPIYFGVGGDPLCGQIPRFPAPTGPEHALITNGALYDSEGGPRHILTWPWLPEYIVAGPDVAFPPLEVAIGWTTSVRQDLNASMLPGAADTVTIERGATVGTFNGRPLIASCKLAVLSGSFVARAAAVRRPAAA
jgi:hypothetical protein